MIATADPMTVEAAAPAVPRSKTSTRIIFRLKSVIFPMINPRAAMTSLLSLRRKFRKITFRIISGAPPEMILMYI